MKILHVLYSGLGGHGNVFFSLIDADKAKEFKYEALFYGIENVRDEYLDKCLAKNVTWYFSKKNYKVDPIYYINIFRSIYQSNPDVIFLHGSGYIVQTMIFKIFFGRKCKIVVRETQANHLKTSLQKITLFFSLLFANKIVFLTEQFARQVQTMLPWVFKTSKISVIPNGIDLELYQPAPPPNNNCVFIGMQSRLIKIKDHLTLLKAFSMLKNRGDQFNDLKLVIVGDGDFKSILINKAIALDIDKDVNFAGMLREPELIDFLHSLDLYIHASLGETMSTAIMQAMACKLPVIASDVDGINNMITNNTTGLLVPVTDAKALCDAMYLCITQAEVRTKIANSSYEFALNNFSNTAMFQKYKSVFN